MHIRKFGLQNDRIGALAINIGRLEFKVNAQTSANVPPNGWFYDTWDIHVMDESAD
jgi:hypothetical protein